MKAQDYITAAKALRLDEWDESAHPRAENGQFRPGKLSPKEKTKIEELHRGVVRGEPVATLNKYIAKLRSAEFKKRDPTTGRIQDEAKHERLRWASEQSGKARDDHLRDLGADLENVTRTTSPDPNPWTETVKHFYGGK